MTASIVPQRCAIYTRRSSEHNLDPPSIPSMPSAVVRGLHQEPGP
jgi:hypothetical protein